MELGGLPLKIRRARTNEAEVLSQLAMCSKAVWGYSVEFMKACRAELTLSEDYIQSSETFVVDISGQICGFYSLVGSDPGVALDYLYVEPESIGNGYGRQLWNHAVERATQLKYRSLTIDADPHAEQFYLRMGANRIGEVASGSIPGRVLPQLAT